MRYQGTLAVVWAASFFTSPVLASDQPSLARPIGNPGDWIKSTDYPPAAFFAHVEGVIGLKLTIDNKGGVSECLVESGNGSAILGDASCRIIKERGRFYPATDIIKRFVPSVYRMRVNWKMPTLPIGSLPTKRTTARVSFDFDANGQLKNCRILEWPGPGDGNVLCRHAPPPLGAFNGEDGKPTPYSAVLTQSVVFEAHPLTKPDQNSTNVPSQASHQ